MFIRLSRKKCPAKIHFFLKVQSPYDLDIYNYDHCVIESFFITFRISGHTFTMAGWTCISMIDGRICFESISTVRPAIVATSMLWEYVRPSPAVLQIYIVKASTNIDEKHAGFIQYTLYCSGSHTYPSISMLCYGEGYAGCFSEGQNPQRGHP